MYGYGYSLYNRTQFLNSGGIDPSAQAFITATGITGVTQQTAINNLVTGLKTDGLWSKMKAVYPFVTDNRNLWSYTNDVTAGNWVRSGFTATANATTAPDGTTTADTLTENTSGGNHYIANQGGAIALSNGNCTMSIYVKKIVRDWFAISLFDGTTTRNAWFNINTGVVGTVQSGATASISDAGNGWYRCSITMPMSASNVNFTAYYGANADNSIVYTGNGLASYYVWGAQLEIGSLSTYQPIATTQQAYIAAQFKYNLVNPVDSDAAFRLVFNGGWTHSSNGATPNGTNGYADTKLNTLSNLTPSNNHVSIYSRTNLNGTIVPLSLNVDMGITNNATYSFNQIATRLNGNFTYENGSQVPSAAVADSLGFYVGSSISSTSGKAYKNGTLLATNTTTQARTMFNNNIYIAATNNVTTGTAFYYSSRQYAFSTIGDGLTDTEAANLYSRVQQFQVSLSRNV